MDDDFFQPLRFSELRLGRPAGTASDDPPGQYLQYAQAVRFMQRSGRGNVPIEAVIALVAYLRKDCDVPSVRMVERQCELFDRAWAEVPAGPAALRSSDGPRLVGLKRPARHRPKIRRKPVFPDTELPVGGRKPRLTITDPSCVPVDEVRNLLRPDFGTVTRKAKARPRARAAVLGSVVPFAKADTAEERPGPLLW